MLPTVALAQLQAMMHAVSCSYQKGWQHQQRKI